MRVQTRTIFRKPPPLSGMVGGRTIRSGCDIPNPEMTAHVTQARSYDPAEYMGMTVDSLEQDPGSPESPYTAASSELQSPAGRAERRLAELVEEMEENAADTNSDDEDLDWLGAAERVHALLVAV